MAYFNFWNDYSTTSTATYYGGDIWSSATVSHHRFWWYEPPVLNEYGTSGDDKLTGTGADNTLYGLGGDDHLTVFGDQNVDAGEGDDTILSEGRNGGHLDGGNGIDTLEISEFGYGTDVDLAAGTYARTAHWQNHYDDKAATLEGIEHVIGSSFEEALTGDGGANVLNGRGGRDTIIGGGGDDVIIGGSGADLLTGGTGADTFVVAHADLYGTHDVADVVTDFETGIDQLDLSAMSEVGVLFIGDASFASFSGFAQSGWALARAESFGALTQLQVSLDDDAAPEWSVALSGVSAIGVDDLIL